MKKIEHAIEYAILMFFLGISKILPRHIASTGYGSLISFFASGMAVNRKPYRHIQQALKTDKVETQRISEDMWMNLGRVLSEFPHLKTIAENDVTFVGGEYIEQLRDDGKCGVLFGAHLGNWEVIPHALISHYDFKMHPVYRAPNNKFVDKKLHAYRTPDNTLIAYPKSAAGMKGMMKALKSGEHLGLLIDQKYNEGVDAPFFGINARTGVAFIELAKKFDCPLVPIRCIRDYGTNFTIEVSAPIETKDRDVMDILAECHALLETWIKEYPEQWLWLHKRWRAEDLDSVK